MTALWYIVSEERQLLLDGFIMQSSNSCGLFTMHNIMSYVLNSLPEIVLILLHNLGLTDQTMNNSLFHLMWVAGADNLYE
jgi:hypothetical protein